MAPNNVNVERMEAFRKEVEEDPGAARRHKVVEGTWIFKEGSPQFVAALPFPKGSVEVACEMPPMMGGWGTSPDPLQYCLYGLAACFATTLAGVATEKGVALRRLEIRAENRVDLRKSLGMSTDPIIEAVRLGIHLEGDLDRVGLERLVRLAEERCPGVECVTRSIPLEAILE